MSVKPVEFQVSIPRTFETSKIQQENLKKADLLALQNNFSAKESVTKKMHTVTDSEKTLGRDLKDEDGNKEKDSRKQNGSKEKKQQEDLLFEPGNIDIRI